MQTELTKPGHLLKNDGTLAQIGWSRQARLDCNFEQAAFYPRPLRFLQRLRLKRWDYYAVFTPQRFFSATIADLGYAGNVFVYLLDWESGKLIEEGKVIPLARGVKLPRNSAKGEARYAGQGVELSFRTRPDCRQLSVDWPQFDSGRGLSADLTLQTGETRDSLVIATPIPKAGQTPAQARRFYYNRKQNCLPAAGRIVYGGAEEILRPTESQASLDWGRGVWEYRSFWNWASASGRLPDGRCLGLNLGQGFGNLTSATEDCFVLDGRVHKLGATAWQYTHGEYEQPWLFVEETGRLELTFTPFKVRRARTNLGLIFSEVHQAFGRYAGFIVTDDGEHIAVDNLVGFAEEHRARW